MSSLGKGPGKIPLSALHALCILSLTILPSRANTAGLPVGCDVHFKPGQAFIDSQGCTSEAGFASLLQSVALKKRRHITANSTSEQAIRSSVLWPVGETRKHETLDTAWRALYLKAVKSESIPFLLDMSGQAWTRFAISCSSAFIGMLLLSLVLVWALRVLQLYRHSCGEGKPSKVTDESPTTATSNQITRQRILAVLFAVNAGMQANSSSMLPIAHEVTARANHSLTSSGFLASINQLGGILGLMVFYRLTNTSLRGCLMLQAVLMVGGSLLVFIGHAFSSNLVLMYAGRFLAGMELGVGLVTNLVAVQLSSEKDRTYNIIMNDTMGNLGTSCGYWLTNIAYHLPSVGAFTTEAKVSLIIALYGLLLACCTLNLIPNQPELEALYLAPSPRQEVSPPSASEDDLTLPKDIWIRKKWGMMQLAVCFTVVCWDAVVGRADISIHILVLPANYGLSTVSTSAVMGWINLATVFITLGVLHSGMLGILSPVSEVACLTAYQLAIALLMFKFSTSASIGSAILVSAAFGMVLCLAGIKTNIIKSYSTGLLLFKHKDVLMAFRVLTLGASFVGPIIGRYMCEVCVSQNLLPVFMIAGLIPQFLIWQMQSSK